MTIRTSGAELPTAEEVVEILRHESQRFAVRFDYLQKNASVFDAYRELTKLAGVSADWIADYVEMSLDELAEAIVATHHALIPFIHKHPDPVDLYARVYEALVPAQDDSPSDLIFVFGANSNVRVERAIELYNQVVADKIMLSGNRPYYSDTTEPEAVRMAQFATDAGVPDSALITEDKSITLPDNVKRSLDLLETMSWRPKSITLVATNFVLRRAMMDWYKFTPWDVEIKTVSPPVQSARFSASGWHKDDLTIQLVLNEYAKMVIESKMDMLRRDDQLRYYSN